MTFLPSTYEAPKQGGNYYRFKQGDNNFRILSSAIIGWLDWSNEKKPVRTKERQEAINTDRQPKHFWAFIVKDLDDGEIKIMEITQSTIQGSIFALTKNVKWGDPKSYDLTINKTGEKMETKYSVIPSPHSELDEETKTEYKEANINLEALFDGANPFDSQLKEAKETFGDDINVDDAINEMPLK